MDIIEEEKVVEKFGIAVRMIKDSGTYIVQQTPINEDGSYDKGDFTFFGGTVGYETSEFDSEEDARKFFDDIMMLNGSQLAERYPKIWVD